MKRFFKVVGFFLVGVILLALLAYLVFFIKWKLESSSNLALLGEEAPTLTLEGYQFRDLNKNGKLDVYEDSRAHIENRIDDLLDQMNIEEKAGMMFVHFLPMEEDGSLLEIPTFSDPFSFMTESTSSTILKKKMNHECLNQLIKTLLSSSQRAQN